MKAFTARARITGAAIGFGLVVVVATLAAPTGRAADGLVPIACPSLPVASPTAAPSGVFGSCPTPTPSSMGPATGRSGGARSRTASSLAGGPTTAGDLGAPQAGVDGSSGDQGDEGARPSVRPPASALFAATGGAQRGNGLAALLASAMVTFAVILGLLLLVAAVLFIPDAADRTRRGPSRLRT